MDIETFKESKFYDVSTEYNYHFERNVFYIEPLDDDIIRNSDTLGFYFVFNSLNEKIGLNSPGFHFINSAYACSPSEDTYTLKYKIDSVLITSDTTYNGIEAGNSLNAFFFKPSKDKVSLDNVIAQLNQEGGVSPSNQFVFFIATDKKPGYFIKHKLFLKIYKSNNEIIEGETNLFVWY